MTDARDAASPHAADHRELRLALGDVRRQLTHLEELAAGDRPAVEPVRPGPESRWPSTAAVAAAVALQVALPGSLTLGPRWLLPALEAALGAALVAANPRRVVRRDLGTRATSVVLVALTSLANAWASGELIRGIVVGSRRLDAASLLGHGASIYLTNIIVFALWYWEWDAGGPVARAQGPGRPPDFLFPQMTAGSLVPEGWRPTFPDYLYLSYTNATAFSPTDTMPLAHWAKLLMLVQSAVALLTIGLVVARAVNILP